jgi:hypothetical protein
VTIGGRSVGWLRVEATSAGYLAASIRSHEPDQALLNAQARTLLSGLTPQTALDTLAIAIEPAAKLAAWRVIRRETLVGLPNSSGPDASPSPADQPTDLRGIVNEALARLAAPLDLRRCVLTAGEAQAFDPATGAQRRRAVLDREGRAIASVDLVTASRTVDITVTTLDRTRSGLDRRHRLDVPTPEALAAALLTCLLPVLDAV